MFVKYTLANVQEGPKAVVKMSVEKSSGPCLAVNFKVALETQVLISM